MKKIIVALLVLYSFSSYAANNATVNLSLTAASPTSISYTSNNNTITPGETTTVGTLTINSTSTYHLIMLSSYSGLSNSSTGGVITYTATAKTPTSYTYISGSAVNTDTNAATAGDANYDLEVSVPTTLNDGVSAIAEGTYTDTLSVGIVAN
jgi:hypothetical protein